MNAPNPRNNQNPTLIMFVAPNNATDRFGFILFASIPPNNIEIFEAIQPNGRGIEPFFEIIIVPDEVNLAEHQDFFVFVQNIVFPDRVVQIGQRTLINDWDFGLVDDISDSFHQFWLHDIFQREIRFIANRTNNNDLRQLLLRIISGTTLPNERGQNG
jgi:hypothetical protein